MTFRCNTCRREFNTEKNLEIHKAYHRKESDTPYIERYKQIRSEIPERYKQAYDELTGQGRTPKCVQAAIVYIESTATQDLVSESYDVTNVTIRKITREFVERGVVSMDYILENCAQNGDTVFGERRAGETKWAPTEA